MFVCVIFKHYPLDNIFWTKAASRILYLRNKETQQTLRVIVSIQYDASF